MPYSKTADLPATFQKLPEAAKQQAMAVMNDCLARGDDETSAIKQAWGAVKASWTQDADGNWSKKPAKAAEKKEDPPADEKPEGDSLETVDIPDVEILGVGTWSGHPKPIEITTDDLDEMVKSFKALSANPDLNYEPPIKLGHDEKQKLLQADGYPAAGWIKTLKRVGDKLVGTFGSVPKKVAELMKAGAYKKRSAEINGNYEIGGKTYKWVLKAVALLGADIPAVKSIADIQALYGEPAAAQTIVFYESLDKQLDVIRDSWYRATRPAQVPMIPAPAADDVGWIREILSDSVIVSRGPKYFRVPYTEKDGVVSFQMDKAEEVESVWKPITKSATELAQVAGVGDIKSTKAEASMDAIILKELGIEKEADALAAIQNLKKKPEGMVTLAEHTAVQTELASKNAKLAELERDTRVGAAIQAGKITPAQKAWADKYALSDPAGFDTFIQAQPAIVKFGEKGAQGGEPTDVTLNETDLKVAKAMGTPIEALKAARKEELAAPK